MKILVYLSQKYRKPCDEPMPTIQFEFSTYKKTAIMPSFTVF